MRVDTAELRKLSEAAEPGTFCSHNKGYDGDPRIICWVQGLVPHLGPIMRGYLGQQSETNCRFYVAARTALPALLDELDALRAELEELEEADGDESKTEADGPDGGVQLVRGRPRRSV